MNTNIYKHIIQNKDEQKICARHPVSRWKAGYKRCYWGFKLNQDCVELLEKGGEKMSKFDDSDVISRYSRQQAVDDGVLVEVLRWHDIPVMATSHISDEFGLGELLNIWHEFRAWKEHKEPRLPEAVRLFHTETRGKTVWVIEDGEAFTIMYPDDY